jgi:hypothetical protein
MLHKDYDSKGSVAKKKDELIGCKPTNVKWLWPWNSSISETVRIGHMYIYNTFLFRMTDTMTYQNIDLSSWDTLYVLYMQHIEMIDFHVIRPL